MKTKARLKILVPLVVIGTCVVVLLVLTGRRHVDPGPDANTGEQAATDSRGLGPGDSRTSTATAGELRERIRTATPGAYPELMGELLRLRDPDAREELVADLVRRWLDADVQAFAAFLDEMEIAGDPVWNRLAPGLVAALGQLESETADSFLVQEVVGRVIRKAAQADPASALAWAREWLTGSYLDAALAGIATELVNFDPEAAISLVEEIKATSNRMTATTGVGAVLGQSDPDRGLEWARSFSLESERAFALSGVLSGMASRDTARASSEYAAVVDTMKESYRAQVLADRAESGTSVEEEYEGLSREEIVKAELARPNPNLVYLEKAAYVVATAMARRDPESALAWANSLDIYQGGMAAIEAVFETWSARDPQAAFGSYLLQDRRNPGLAGEIFGAWASADPSAASAAALSLADGPERIQAIEGVAQGWLASGASPVEVARWSGGLASSGEMDAVRAVLASEAASGDPVFAWNQIERIDNPTKQSQLFQEVFPSLATQHPEVARRALEGVNLSKAEMEYFEDMLRN